MTSKTRTRPDFQLILRDQTPSVEKLVDPRRDKLFCYDFMAYASSRKNCIGLAANQLSVNGDRLQHRMFAMVSTVNTWFLVCNPEIIQYIGDTKLWKEKCLTWPGMSMNVNRFQDIKVKYLDFDSGEYVERRLFGREALIFQHEIDHLNGVEEKFVSTQVIQSVKLKRNDPCGCGAKDEQGKSIKYKNCCLFN